MFKEIGDRLQNGTMNLSITQKEGRMSVIVSFKGVPGLTEALFSGTAEEIEEEFIERLEQPMKAISKFNFDMDQFNDAILKETENKKKKLDELKKEADKKKAVSEKKKKDEEVKEKTQASLDLSAEPACELENIVEDLDQFTDQQVNDALTKETMAEKENQVSVLKFNEKQKQEIIEAGLNANSTDHKEKMIAKIIYMRGCNRITAETYFANNIEKLFDEALLHKNNVERMKDVVGQPEANKPNVFVDNDEFDPFADDFQL